jgi:hypothetical protein
LPAKLNFSPQSTVFFKPVVPSHENSHTRHELGWRRHHGIARTSRHS